MAETGIKLTRESANYLAWLKRFGTPGYVEKQIVGFFKREGQIVAGRISTDWLSGGNGLRRRTGSLARSVVGQGEVYGGVPAIRVGSLRGPALRYVAVHEFGTVGAGGTLPTIVPKQAKNLAMPVGKALTPSGVPKYPSPRNYPGKLYYVPVRKGNVTGLLFDAAEYRRLLASKIATSGSELMHSLDTKTLRGAFKGRAQSNLRNFQAVYVLLRRMDIKPTRFLHKGFQAYLPELVKNLNAFIKALFFAGGRKPQGAGA